MHKKVRRLATSALFELFPAAEVARMRRAAPPEAELAYLDQLCPRDGTAIDVGANFGLYTSPLARLAKVVHAIEPSPRMARLLRRTQPSHVQVHQVAASDHRGEATLWAPRTPSGYVAAGLGSLEATPPGPAEAIQVSLTRLDELVTTSVDFVKIDVEGHELAALRGADRIFDAFRPTCVVEAEERHRPSAVSTVLAYFSARNYRGFFQRAGRLVPADTFHIGLQQDPTDLQAYVNNFIFVPAEHPLAG